VLTEIEQARLRRSLATDPARKARLGQFLTPARTAAFMASMFPPSEGDCRLLDAGAGIGSLSVAFVDRWKRGELGFDRVDVDAFELDATLHGDLTRSLAACDNGRLSFAVHGGDFVEQASASVAGDMFAAALPRYSHIILNPPYKKISSDSTHRLALRRAGIETVNLYSAFVALAVALAAPGGQIVAIIPRSFCNGPYYRHFRSFILDRAAIRHIHLFDARNKAFKDDDVLQENVIIRLERDGQPGPVTVSTSTDDTFSDVAIHDHPFCRIVHSDDSERFVHIPAGPEATALELSSAVRCTLAELGVSVSTGPIVDYRLKEHLRDAPVEGSVPLLYPAHFSGGSMSWPILGMKKPNAIMLNEDSRRWMYPTGTYCVVRRFSSKEEARRIVASVVNPEAFGDARVLGFENHLNVFHADGGGLPVDLAHGLAAFLNTSAVDEAFRRFNGHTQVNATDLRRMKYPSVETLTEIGRWAARHGEPPTQTLLDQQLLKATA